LPSCARSGGTSKVQVDPADQREFDVAGTAERQTRQGYRFRLLATMTQGTVAALPEAWQGYQSVQEARIAAREMMRDHRVVRVAIIEDRIPLQLVEWVSR
jgi:hypothetical protein